MLLNHNIMIGPAKTTARTTKTAAPAPAAGNHTAAVTWLLTSQLQSENTTWRAALCLQGTYSNFIRLSAKSLFMQKPHMGNPWESVSNTYIALLQFSGNHFLHNYHRAWRWSSQGPKSLNLILLRMIAIASQCMSPQPGHQRTR